MIPIEIPSMVHRAALERIAQQLHQCHVHWRPDIFEPARQLLSEEELGQLIRQEKIFAAKEDGAVVGYATVSTRELKSTGCKYSRTLNIDALAVEQSHRGRGVGTALLEFLKTHAAENGDTDIRLTVNEENETAIRLYEKAGFRVKNIAYSLHIAP